MKSTHETALAILTGLVLVGVIAAGVYTFTAAINKETAADAKKEKQIQNQAAALSNERAINRELKARYIKLVADKAEGEVIQAMFSEWLDDRLVEEMEGE